MPINECIDSMVDVFRCDRDAKRSSIGSVIACFALVWLVVHVASAGELAHA